MAIQTSFFKIFTEIGLCVEIKGCWFHFNQAIIHKIINLGLLGLYCSKHKFKLWIRQFGALALIPLSHLSETWNIILSSFPDDCLFSSTIMEFIIYFINTWLHGKHAAGPNVWNVYSEEILGYLGYFLS